MNWTQERDSDGFIEWVRDYKNHTVVVVRTPEHRFWAYILYGTVGDPQEYEIYEPFNAFYKAARAATETIDQWLDNEQDWEAVVEDRAWQNAPNWAR